MKEEEEDDMEDPYSMYSYGIRSVADPVGSRPVWSDPEFFFISNRIRPVFSISSLKGTVSQD